jgi:hypothetical protein
MSFGVLFGVFFSFSYRIVNEQKLSTFVYVHDLGRKVAHNIAEYADMARQRREVAKCL